MRQSQGHASGTHLLHGSRVGRAVPGWSRAVQKNHSFPATTHSLHCPHHPTHCGMSSAQVLIPISPWHSDPYPLLPLEALLGAPDRCARIFPRAPSISQHQPDPGLRCQMPDPTDFPVSPCHSSTGHLSVD